MPTSGIFLQGTAFIDANGDHTLDQNDEYLPNATISLYQGPVTILGTPSGPLVATTTTNSSGAYLFDGNSLGLTPGTYTLVETPPLGYTNTGTQVLTQLNPATTVNASTIQVTLVDTSNLFLAMDANYFFNRNAWDYLQQDSPVQFQSAGVTNGSFVVTMTNTASLNIGENVIVSDGTTTLNSTVASISANTSITLNDGWTGSTGNAATVSATDAGTAGQLPITPVDPSVPPVTQYTNAGVTQYSSTVTMTNTAGFSAGTIVEVTTGTTTLYSMVTSVSPNSSITLDDQWGGSTGNMATVDALQTVPPGTNPFLSLCWDLENSLGDSYSPPPVSVTNVFQVTPTSGQGTPLNAGMIGYLFNHYGTVDITNAAADNAALADANAPVPSLATGTIAEAVGLQVAVWELEYGNTFSNLMVLSRLNDSSNPTVTQELSDINTWANFYTADATNKTETATFLQVTGNVLQLGEQGLICAGSLNFGNAKIPVQSPTITTKPNLTSVPLGTSTVTLTDTADLEGGFQPTGGITFTLYGPGNVLLDTETVGVSGNGTYTTPTGFTLPVTGTVIGTYQWDATYNGDTNNNQASDIGDVSEQVVVSPATPTITTTPSVTTVMLGTTSVTLNDTAVLSGGYSPTGTITFTLYLGSTLLDTETANVTSGNGSYTTPTGYTLLTTGTVTGTYQWDATYNGDTNNKKVSDNNDSKEQVVVSPAQPTITTTPSVTTVTLGTTSVTLKDTAVLSGGYSPTGTITFTLYLGSTLLDTETANVTSGNGSYTTPTGYTLLTTGTVTGTYQWDATYSGDTNNKKVSDNNDSKEQVVVSPACPTITTTPSVTTVTLGTSSVTLKDTAVLSGGYSPTGTITFTLYLGSTLLDTETANVTSGNGSYTTPTGYTLLTTGTVTGTYQWDATYNGDTNNKKVSDNNDSKEQVVVSPAQPSITTTPSVTTVTLGTTSVTLKDTAVLSGGYSPTGTITFTLYLGSTLLDTETANVTSGNGSYTTPTGYTLLTTGTVTGTYQWDATYNGDTNNKKVSDNNDIKEQVVVSPACPMITTTPNVTTVKLGTSPVTLKDTAVLSGGYSPTGTITFTLYLGSTLLDTETANVTSGNGSYTTPTGYTLPTTGMVTGTYQWDATYNGDANNKKVSDNNDSKEQVTVTPMSPTIVTTPGGPVALGSFTINGTKYLDVTGDGFSTDDTLQSGVTINLYLESNSTAGLQVGSGGDTFVASTTTASNGTYSFTLAGAGTYYVQESVPAGYVQTGGGPNGSAGNAYYTITPVSGHSYAGNNFDDYLVPTCTPTCVSFKVTTPSNSSTTVTNLSGNTQQGDTVTATFTVPAGMSDQLTLVSYTAPGAAYSDSNAYQQVIYKQATGIFPPGTYSITVQIPNCYYQIDFVCGPAIGQLEPIQNGNAYGPDSAEILYHAENRFISGDNGGTTAPNPMPSPTPATPPTSTPPVTPALVLTDSATLSGANKPTGTITFYLFAPGVTPNGTDSNNVYSDAVPVSGNGSYNTGMGNNPGGYIPMVGGTYQWVAVYSGDANNSGATSSYGSEPETVNQITPTITTTPCPTAVTLCTTAPILKDTATLSGGQAPTGTITFTLYLGTTLVDTETATVTGNGSYTTPTGYTLPITGTVTGTYQWDATYSGDASNKTVSDNNDCNEQVKVCAASPTIVTSPTPTTVTLGVGSQVLKDTATLAGGYYETGTITFTLYLGSTKLDTETVSVKGNGSYTTATGYTLPANASAGTYQWDATYNGDGNNICASDINDCKEQVVVCPAPITITGTKFNDISGNGFSFDDTGKSGVTINLYKESNNCAGLQTGSGGDYLVATTTTDSNGNYSFTNLTAGTTYYVQEVVPAGYVQTGGGPNGSAGCTYYTICAQTGHAYAGNNFDDFQVPTCTPTCVSYTVNNNNSLKTVSDLSGNTLQGDTVTATFTVPSGMNDQLTLVSYIAPGSSFNAATAYQQMIYQQATGIFTPGTHTLTIAIPNCYYQIDFVCGLAINQLEPSQNNNAYGPDSANIFYHAEGRFFDSDNGGTTACSTKPVASGDFASAVYWTTTTGKNVINKLNGGSSATNLAQWLATTLPNLYGAGAGSHSLVNSNGTYFTNSSVATAYSTQFAGGDQQVLSAALSVYATSINLAGINVHNTDSNFNTSLAGSGMDTYSVGTNGAAFGLTGSPTLTVSQLLGDLNANTTAGAAVSSGGGAVFTSINSVGNVTNASVSLAGTGFGPAGIRTAYGVNNVSLDGTGQTIAIVDAYDDPNIFQSVDAFDGRFGISATGATLAQQYGPASSFLTVVNQNGQAAPLPSVDSTGTWELEIALDVEWAHAMAPGANIVLVEANSQALGDLMSSVAAAAHQPGVSVVSMSWGFREGQAALAQDETLYDSYMTTPAGHQGVTFVASTGDYGSADPEYPAFSPNVVAVGGTSLYTNADGSYQGETGWDSSSNTNVGSGGGISMFEAEPAFQQAAQSTGHRSTPDVSMVADPNTGVWFADTYNLSAAGSWQVAGGTSLAAPSWAGLFAIVNEGREAAGSSTLNSASPTEAQLDLYSLPTTAFHNVTNGASNSGANYNFVTGLGTPVASTLVPDLVAAQGGGEAPSVEASIISINQASAVGAGNGRPATTAGSLAHSSGAMLITSGIASVSAETNVGGGVQLSLNTPSAGPVSLPGSLPAGAVPSANIQQQLAERLFSALDQGLDSAATIDSLNMFPLETSPSRDGSGSFFSPTDSGADMCRPSPVVSASDTAGIDEYFAQMANEGFGDY